MASLEITERSSQTVPLSFFGRGWRIDPICGQHGLTSFGESYMKKTLRSILTYLMVAGGVIALSQCNPPNVPPPTVKYSVTGTGTITAASVTYTNETGGTDQFDVSLPWSYSFSSEPGKVVELLVSLSDYSQVGVLTATIYVNGSVLQTSSGNASAIAGGTVP